MENIIVREATIDDIPEVAKLHLESWNRTYKGMIDQDYLDNMKNNLDKRIERMKNEFSLRKMIVAVIDDEIVAFSEFTLTNEFSNQLDIDCELCGLYVKNEYVGRGVGTVVFNYVVDIFKKNNKNKMGLWCLKDNINAINFYENKGGKKTSTKTFGLAGKEYIEIAFQFNLTSN